MRRIFTLFLFTIFLFFQNTSHAQLVVDNSTYTVPSLVNNVMLGFGASVSNITFTGDTTAIGFFDGGNSNIGLDSGIVIASGNILTAVGPNSSGSSGTSFGLPGDPDLTAIAGNNTNDAAILEFDFIPSNDTFSFNFVFGSEEYPEFVNSINDAFAFWISGPGITGNQNIALIPGTTTPVTINTVNDQVNTQYYVDNTGGATVEYDGFTTVLEATSGVMPDSTYHIKIAIADASDGIYDSGVFLQKNCEYEPATTEFTNSTPIVLGCGDSTLTITLNQPILCSTLEDGGTDFRLLDPNGQLIPIINATGTTCNGNVGATTTITVETLFPLGMNGTYYFFSKIGNDANTLLSACDGVPLAEFDTLEIVVEDCYDIIPDLINVSVEENEDIDVMWKVPADTVPSNPWSQLFEEYMVFRSPTPGGSYAQIGSVASLTDTTYRDTTVEVQTNNYNYQVAVKLSDGFESMRSDTIQSILLTEDPTAPPSDTTNVHMLWTEYWGWSDPIYYVYQSTSSGGWAVVDSTQSLTYVYPKPQDAGTYQLKVEAHNSPFGSGVTAESNWLNFDVIAYDVVIPNVITPTNEDPESEGKNDVFFIRNLNQYPGSSLRVYNRWGRKVFESNDYQNDWDGDKLRGGTYYYILSVNDSEGTEKTGTFLLIK